MKFASLITVIFVTLLISGCFFSHSDWKVEAERTNQMQVHENGLTERQVLSNSMVSNAIDQMNK